MMHVLSEDIYDENKENISAENIHQVVFQELKARTLFEPFTLLETYLATCNSENFPENIRAYLINELMSTVVNDIIQHKEIN